LILRSHAAIVSNHERVRATRHQGKIDLRNEKIGFKIREHSMQRIPYLVIVGDKELEDQNITVVRKKVKI